MANIYGIIDEATWERAMNMSGQEVIELARRNGFDLKKYEREATTCIHIV